MVNLVEKRESGYTETYNHCTHTVWHTAELGQGYLCLRGNEGPTQIVMYKTIFVINIIIHMCLQHSNTL